MGVKQQLLGNLNNTSTQPRLGSPSSGFHGRNTSSAADQRVGYEDGKTIGQSQGSNANQQVSMEHVQMLEKKNKLLGQKLDDMSKKMDMIIKILEFILGEFPHQRLQNMPDSLRGVFNPSNLKIQNGNSVLNKLFESQQHQ